MTNKRLLFASKLTSLCCLASIAPFSDDLLRQTGGQCYDAPPLSYTVLNIRFPRLLGNDEGCNCMVVQLIDEL